MTLARQKPFSKTCKNPACRLRFETLRSLQIVCGPACALIWAQARREKERLAIAQRERRTIRACKARLKSRADYLKETQAVFNQWVRLRDAELPCISCSRHHEGKYDAGHYRTVGSNPALRFEPLNCHKQCVPCNRYKSGDLVNYRLNLLLRIGAKRLAWLEGPHEPKHYSIDELKVLKAEFQAHIKHLKGAA
ncbi:recombination protein NinG [Pseudomonas sp. LJDD11]|uniref:recombination protein NinG n=1 Tax=unclassified Pseudomonas TaxID=196821 RepID=UPI002096D4F4|nr:MULTISPECIES: recombination protein NinG [unclassified Pseudomonas]MCO8160956.1 recombination protein NinG [Pseudomonas sp. 21LCFQ010]MCQ9426700.1 recombination protein NinG [Pseudomonas sp. LJDD11]